MTTFTTSAGKVLQIQPVPPLLVEEVRLRAQETVEVPPVPTYEVVLEDGTVLHYEHDQKSILDSLTKEEDRKLWDQRQIALRKQAAVASSKLMDLFFARGVVLEPEELEGPWREFQEFLGIDLPTNPFALKLHYIKTEILNNVDDLYGAMSAIMGASGIDPKILEAAKRSFPSNLRLQANSAGGTGGPLPAAGTGQVEDQLQIPRDGAGEELGTASQ